MLPQPTLTTARLVLRPFTIDDAADVHRLAGHHLIADTTLNVPHPYHHDDAVKWISTHRDKYDAGELVTFAITLAESRELIGSIGLIHNARHHRAELGYWIGTEHWGRGYCSEAGRAVIAYAFQTLHLRKVTAHCFVRNRASARVIEKLGFQREGFRPEHVRKGDHYEDIIMFGLLSEQFRPNSG